MSKALSILIDLIPLAVFAVFVVAAAAEPAMWFRDRVRWEHRPAPRRAHGSHA